MARENEPTPANVCNEGPREKESEQIYSLMIYVEIK